MVNRCRNHPVTGMTAAIVSMKMLDSHCALRGLTSKSAISRGIALIMIVSLRMTTNVEATSSLMMRGVLKASGAEPVGSATSVRVVMSVLFGGADHPVDHPLTYSTNE